MNLLDNELAGTVPANVCEIINTYKIDLKVDCFRWLSEPEVSCDCCHSCDIPSMLFTETGCPGDVIEIVGDINNYWELKDLNTQDKRVVMNRIDAFTTDQGRNLRHKLCISRASCFTLQVLAGPTAPAIYPFKILHNGKVVYTAIETAERQFEVPVLGYQAGKDVLVEGKCDAFTLCEKQLKEGTDRREIFNHIAELSEWGKGLMRVPDSPQYQAACWLVTVGNQIPDHRLSVADGSAMQRYVLALLHYQNDAWKTRGEDDKLYGGLDENLATCNWEGVTCNDLGYVTAIELEGGDVVINGHIPSEIGYLTSLKTLRLNGEGRVEEKLVGSIPTEIGRLRHLEELDLGDHEIGGILPNELLELDSLQKLELYSNRLEGNLSSNVTLLESLGKMQHVLNVFSFW